LDYQNVNLKFSLQDNGKGTPAFVKGFGLTAMEERVKELGGILQMQSVPGEGFNISITIPAGRDEIDESN
jgi:signal transduction histidine kinase